MEQLKETFEYIANKLQCIELSDFLSIDELKEILKDGGNYGEILRQLLEDKGAFNIEVIYYSNAMNCLTVNDPSLTNALAIAEKQGYTLADINSELLASLLASNKAIEEYNNAIDDINRYCERFRRNQSESLQGEQMASRST